MLEGAKRACRQRTLSHVYAVQLDALIWKELLRLFLVSTAASVVQRSGYMAVIGLRNAISDKCRGGAASGCLEEL